MVLTNEYVFQSPDGDSVVSHRRKNYSQAGPIQCRFQSPDGDSVVSHAEAASSPARHWSGFQSPDGDSVVSHVQ